MKGRPITAEEYERILDVVPQVRQHDAEAWQRYLTGLWLSGLRLAESILLSWDDDSPIAVDLGGKHPRFRIHGSAQKSGQDQLLPMTPDFAEWLLRTPRGDRTGRVFVLNNLRNGEPLAHGVIGRIVTRIGEKAGVVVNREGKKVKETVEKQVRGKIRKVPTGRLVEEEVTRFASAHDYCRAFGTRWARKVMPATLQLLMRHASIATTMAYYVDLGTDEIADDLWAKHSPETNAGTILGTIDDPPPPLISPPRLAVSPYPERSTGGGS